MATTTAPQEDSAAVIAALTRLLLAFSANEGVLISSESLKLLIDDLGPQLVRAARRGQSITLLQHWQRSLDAIWPRLMNKAQQRGESFGTKRVVFDEEVGQLALSACPPPPDFPDS